MNKLAVNRLEPLLSGRRGAAAVAMVLTMVVASLVMVGMVMGTARDQDSTVQSMNTLRAFYVAEAVMNMGIREVILNTDEDADGGIGSISNDGNAANDPGFGAARAYAATSVPAPGEISITSAANNGFTLRTSTATLTSATGTFGYGTPFGSEQQSVAGRQIATKVSAPVNMTLVSITAYVNGPSPKEIRYGLYADSSGEPAARLTQSYTQAIGGDSAHFHWVTLYVPSTSITAGDYWLALAFENTSMEYAFDTTGGQTRYNNNDAVANGFNTPWGTSTASSTRRINIYATAATETTGTINFDDSSEYDNADPQVLGKFRDLTNPTKIVRGNDVSSNATKYTAVNFTAASGLVADCMTAYDLSPSASDQTNFDGSVRVVADVLLSGTTGSRWIALGALHNETSGQEGLVLALKENGSNDQLQVIRLPANGNLSGATALASSATFNGVSENNWYRLVMDVAVSAGNVQIDGRVFGHATANNPNSAVNESPLKTISYSSATSALSGLQASGEVAVLFDTADAASRGSATNFVINSGIGTTSSPSLKSWTEVQPY